MNDSKTLGTASFIQLHYLRNKYWCAGNPLDIVRRLTRKLPHFTTWNLLPIIPKICSHIYISHLLCAITKLKDPDSIMPVVRQLRRTSSVLFLSQIINNHQELLTWSHLNQIYNIGHRCAPWYKLLSTSVLSSAPPKLKVIISQ